MQVTSSGNTPIYLSNQPKSENQRATVQAESSDSVSISPEALEKASNANLETGAKQTSAIPTPYP